VDREVLANQDELVNILLKAEYHTMPVAAPFYKAEKLDFPTIDDIMNFVPRQDIDDLIRQNPSEYEEFILDNVDLLTDTYSDAHDEWKKQESEEEFLDWLEEFAPFSNEEGEIRMTRQELLRNIVLDDDDIDTLYDYFERNRIEITDEGHEIFSWMLVTDWLADQLEAEGETILRYYNQSWWGRATYGQLIMADAVVQKIAWALWGEDEEADEPDTD
jgi:hypothetical protein